MFGGFDWQYQWWRSYGKGPLKLLVATDCPGGVREILNDGALGPLVPMRDPEAMARALTSQLDEAARAPGPVRHPVERFTEETTVNEYLHALGVPTS